MNTRYQKVFLFLLSTAVFFNNSFGQRGFFIMGGLEMAGGCKKYDFQQRGNKLDRKWETTNISIPANDHDADDYDTTITHNHNSNTRINPEISFNYFFFRHFGLSLGLKLMDETIVLHDKDFVDRINNNKVYCSSKLNNSGGTRTDLGNFSIKEWYVNPSISGYYVFNDPSTASGPFISFGIGFNNFISPSTSVTSNFYYKPFNENLKLQAHFKQSFTSQYLEVGYLILPDNITDPEKPGLKMVAREPAISISLRYSFIGNFVSADYTDTKNGKTQYTDRLTANGSYFAFVLKFGGGIFQNAVDRTYANTYARRAAKTIVQKADTVKLKPSGEFFIPKKARGRKIAYNRTIKVKGKNITISVWDHGRYDEDVISIDVNGNWILENDTLTLEKTSVHADLRDGINYLLFFAVSEGTEKPCTLSVLIDDGYTKQTFIINSTINTSEAIMIHSSP